MGRFRFLTKKEKTLLNVLVSLCIFYLFYRIILKPQSIKKESLKLEENKYNTMIKEQEKIINNEDTIEDKWTNLGKENRDIDKWFINLNQTEIVYTLDSIIDTEEINLLDIEFSNAYNEFKNDFDVNTIGVNISFEGKYNGIVNMVKKIKDSSENMIIDNISIERLNNTQLCNINIKVYNPLELKELDKIITEWR